MKIHVVADYNSYAAFYPVYSLYGQLTSIDLVSLFLHEAANVVIPQEILLPQLDQKQRITLLQNLVAIIDKNYDFFNEYNINVTINIDSQLATVIIDSEFFLRKLALLPFLGLGLDERFEGLHQGKDNTLLFSLSENFNLTLNNFGAGETSTKAIYDRLFTRVKLDKGFICDNLKSTHFVSTMNILLDNITPYCQQVVLPNINDISMLSKISHAEHIGLQSSLFPSANEHELSGLLVPPSSFSGISLG